MPDASTENDITKLSRLLENFDQSKLDHYTRTAMRRLRDAVKLMPMAIVLERIPGADIIAKANSVNVSRSTWYAWKRGKVRPNKQQAALISELTGIPADLFRGRR